MIEKKKKGEGRKEQKQLLGPTDEIKKQTATHFLQATAWTKKK